ETRIPKIRDAALLPATQVREPILQPDRREAPVDPARPATDTPENRASQRAVDLAEQSGSRELYWYVYQFADFDPCHGKFRTDYYQAGVDRLLALERTTGARLDALLGCGVPKLRVVADARVARSPDEARDLLREAVRAGDALPTVIQEDAAQAAPASAPSGAAAASAGRVQVQRFTLAELVAEVDVDAPAGAWLVYDDAFHAGWRASVDGVETAVQPANLAWKAVRVPQGQSSVRLWFDHGANRVLATALAFFGLVAGAGLLLWTAASLLPTRRASPE
ncbi:MAG TPA: hypothetical protein VMW35_02280, partial [Myxococcota bacterium]|nr:hypothetical protein [Myxococcota bacterium]